LLVQHEAPRPGRERQLRALTRQPGLERQHRVLAHWQVAVEKTVLALPAELELWGLEQPAWAPLPSGSLEAPE